MRISKQKATPQRLLLALMLCAIVLRKFQLLVKGEISSFFVVSANNIDNDVDDVDDDDDDENEEEDVYLILTCTMCVIRASNRRLCLKIHCY